MDKTEGISEKDLIQANNELILYPGWFFIDLIIVLFHFITALLLGCPIIIILVSSRLFYYPYNLNSPFYTLSP
jgi:hypothetical protein